MVVIYNVGYHNYNPQGPCANTSDGNGILIDDFGHNQSACPGGAVVCPYTGAVLVMGNIMYNNGGVGIGVFSTSTSGSGLTPVTIVNNTMYSNNWDTFNPATWRGGGSTNAGKNVHFINNIAVAVRGAGILANNSPFVGQQGFNTCPSNNTWASNLSAPASQNNFDGGSTRRIRWYLDQVERIWKKMAIADCNTYLTPPNVDTASAGFTNQSTANPNFALQSGSAAIGIGQAFDLWQQTGTVDAGACPRNAPGPVTNCP
jgi:hypothetical protein